MTRETNLDQIVIQRCVDGELPEIDQINLIKQLDSTEHQGGWRELAIQFMEHQLLTQCFHQNGQVNALLQDCSQTTQKPVPVSKTNRSTGGSYYKMAVAVAAGLVFGVFINQYNSHFSPSSISQVANSTTGSIVNEDGGTSAQRTQSETTLAETTLTSHPGPPTFDVYEFPEGEMVFHEEIVPPEVSRYLAEKGYVIERHSRAFRLPLENGREIIIPSDTIFVRQSHR